MLSALDVIQSRRNQVLAFNANRDSLCITVKFVHCTMTMDQKNKFSIAINVESVEWVAVITLTTATFVSAACQSLRKIYTNV